MEIRKLEKCHHRQLKEMFETVVEMLPSKDLLIVPTAEEIECIFENNNSEFWGFFDEDDLLAVSSLSFDKEDFLEITNLLGIDGSTVAEVAECMTLPQARGNNLMLKINTELVNRAKEKGIKHLIATAHPDNKASNKSLEKLGMVCMGQFMRYGKYLRNYFVMNIDV